METVLPIPEVQQGGEESRRAEKTGSKDDELVVVSESVVANPNVTLQPPGTSPKKVGLSWLSVGPLEPTVQTPSTSIWPNYQAITPCQAIAEFMEACQRAL